MMQILGSLMPRRSAVATAAVRFSPQLMTETRRDAAHHVARAVLAALLASPSQVDRIAEAVLVAA